MTLTPLTLPLSDGGTSSRTPGIHLSGVLRRLAVSQGFYSDTDDRTPDQVKMKRICGLAWEDWLAPRISRMFPAFDYHLGEFSLEDIIGTPDGVSFGIPIDALCTSFRHGWLLHEIKHTRYSSNQMNFPKEKLAPWWWQCMGYLRMLSNETGEECRHAVIHPLFTDGDYRLNRHPQFMPTLLEFTWEEVTDMWAIVQNNKHLAKPEEGYQGVD